MKFLVFFFLVFFVFVSCGKKSEPKHQGKLNKERKLSLIRPVTFEEQVMELKNILSGYTRDVVITAIGSLNLNPKNNKQQSSVDNTELHAPLKKSWKSGFESDDEEEEIEF